MSITLFEFPVAGLVTVSGEDALDYLQSQLTIDCRKLPPSHIRYGLRLNLKGKVLFGAQIIRVKQDEFLIISRDTSSDEIIDLLSANVVADEVEFATGTEECQVSCLYHPESVEEIFKLSGTPPFPANQALNLNDGWLYHDSTLPCSSLCFLHSSNESLPWKNELIPVETAKLERLRLQARIFRAGLEVGEDNFPQEGNLHQDSVDFDKGCYLGQEVMARIHAMGQVRKQTVPVLWKQKLPYPLPISLIQDGKKVGSLKSQFSESDHPDWFGAAVVHENALSDLKTKGLSIEGSDEIIFPFDNE